MAEEYLSLEVRIAGKSYPVKVQTDEKLLVQNLEKEVNDKINEYQQTYSDLNQKDCLSMALLSYAFASKKNSSVKTLGDKLSSLDAMLDKALQ
jgi:cell division protein ZapA